MTNYFYKVLQIKGGSGQRIITRIGDQKVGDYHGGFTSGVPEHYFGYGLQSYLNQAAAAGWRAISGASENVVILENQEDAPVDCELVRAEGCKYCYPETVKPAAKKPVKKQPTKLEKKEPELGHFDRMIEQSKERSKAGA